MKKIYLVLLLIVAFATVEASPKKVLLEIFTNSHCPICPAAHSAIDAYLQNGQYKEQVNFIYYHMVFPYSDDALHQHNPIDASARNLYYGPFSSTPRGVFDGQVQNNSYANWANVIDGLAVQQSPFEITLQGSVNGSNVTVMASIKQTENITPGNLVAHFIAVEDVNYAGRNGISFHKNVMRKMYPSASGRSFSIALNQTIQLDEVTALNPLWNLGELGYLVFVQNTQTKAVYQSEFISYNTILATGLDTGIKLPNDFTLSQNHPNPFNPSTKISWRSPIAGHQSLKVYNILGKEVATLVNEFRNAGKFEVTFDAAQLTSGVYFYKLQSGSFVETKKMLLLK